MIVLRLLRAEERKKERNKERKKETGEKGDDLLIAASFIRS
jgi:hypothetical protein